MKREVEAIVSGVKGLTLAHQAVFLLACAQRMVPVVSRLASVESGQRYVETVDMLWPMLSSSDALMNLPTQRTRLLELPEWDAEDSERPDYYAMIAMYPLQAAFTILAGAPPGDAVKSSCFCTIDLCAELDADVEVRSIAHDQPLDVGPLERAELSAQAAVLQILVREPELTKALHDHVRQRAIDASGPLEESVRRFADQRGWLTSPQAGGRRA